MRFVDDGVMAMGFDKLCLCSVFLLNILLLKLKAYVTDVVMILGLGQGLFVILEIKVVGF